MINNFDEVKRQLSELATVINSYTSEAVQLRIVELIFNQEAAVADSTDPGDDATGNRAPRRARRRRPKPAVASDEAETSPKARQGSGKKGAVALLNRLVDENFFASSRSLNDIVQHCDTKLATKFKPQEVSSKIIRLVRAGRLTRSKNKDGQYEYKQG
jgi:hypothetical protein